MHGMLWEFEQQRQIAGVRHDARAAKDDTLRMKDSIRLLERRLEKLTLISRAMWSILQDRFGVTDEHLSDKVTEIDLLDGELDGQVKKQPADCASCGRKISKRHVRCMYCGSEKLSDSEFDRV